MAANFMRSGMLRGAGAGLFAGALFFVYMGLINLGHGGFFFLARAAAIPFFGAPEGLQAPTGAGALLVGLLAHLVIATVIGVAYSWATWSQPKGLTLIMAFGWGILTWAVMTYGVAPAAGAGAFVQTVPIGKSLVGHTIFGVSMGFAFMPGQRREQRPGRILAPAAAGARA